MDRARPRVFRVASELSGVQERAASVSVAVDPLPFLRGPAQLVERALRAPRVGLEVVLAREGQHVAVRAELAVFGRAAPAARLELHHRGRDKRRVGRRRAGRSPPGGVPARASGRARRRRRRRRGRRRRRRAGDGEGANGLMSSLIPGAPNRTSAAAPGGRAALRERPASARCRSRRRGRCVPRGARRSRATSAPRNSRRA